MAQSTLVPALTLIVALGAVSAAHAATPVESAEFVQVAAAKRAKKKKKRKRRIVRPKGPTLVDRRLAVGTTGLRLGVNTSKLYCDCQDEPDFDSITGVVAGVTYDKAINHALSYRIEGLYVTKGAQLEFTVTDDMGESASDDLDLVLAYFEVGGQGIVRFTLNRAVSFYLGIGPYIAFLTNIDARLDGKKARGFDKKAFEDGDYGMSLTGGALFGVNRHVGLLASVQFTYSHGLADIDDHQETNTDDDDTTHTRSFYLTGGVHF